jgi:hypothetical protein
VDKNGISPARGLKLREKNMAALRAVSSDRKTRFIIPIIVPKHWILSKIRLYLYEPE